MMLRPAGLMGLLLLLAAPLMAQDSSPRCFSPRPSPTCGSWFITEAGARYRVSDRYQDEQNVYFHYALGWMHNVGRRSALGGELFGGSDRHARGGVAIRAREWLSNRASVDLVAGVHLLGDASGQEVKAGSPTVQLRVSHSDKMAVVASVASNIDSSRISVRSRGANHEPNRPPTALAARTRVARRSPSASQCDRRSTEKARSMK